MEKNAEQINLERQVQELRLELEENSSLIEKLKLEVERQRLDTESRIKQAVEVRLDALMNAASSPVVQLLTQWHLLNVEGKPIQAKDVCITAKKIISVLQDSGLSFESEIGDVVTFDPTKHEGIGDGAVEVQDRVKVRFVGTSFGGKILKKAGVLKVEV